MTHAILALSSSSRALTLGLLACVGLSLACIPSLPPCNCTLDGEGGSGDFPDFDLLDRAELCSPDVPLPDDATDADACGYPEGPYGFTVDDVFANLEMFDCEGNTIQVAQLLPQEGLPDVETRGVVFGVGALWCQPCQIEGMEWAAEGGPVDEHPEIQFLQALDQGISPTEPVNADGCMGWSDSVASGKFPIYFVAAAGGLQSQLQTVPNEPIPYTLIFDANANVRFRQTGGVVDESILSAQLDEIVSNPYGN